MTQTCWIRSGCGFALQVLARAGTKRDIFMQRAYPHITWCHTVGCGCCRYGISKACVCCFYCSSIIAQLISRSLHGAISNTVQVHDSAWPATHGLNAFSNRACWIESQQTTRKTGNGKKIHPSCLRGWWGPVLVSAQRKTAAREENRESRSQGLAQKQWNMLAPPPPTVLCVARLPVTLNK